MNANPCARSACRTPTAGRSHYRIKNDGAHGWRTYCVPCGRKIIEFNREMHEQGQDCILLEYEIIKDPPT